jgi:dihydrofolate reductase
MRSLGRALQEVEMRKISVVNFVTLDGVMQSPADPNEDPSGGFSDGGWVTPYLDEDWGRAAGEGMAESDALLLGRNTYEKMFSYWPSRPDDDPFAAKMNHSAKYVVSNTLDQVTWENTTLIKGDAVAQITALKQQPGKNITVLGSGGLLQTLMEHDLVDEYALLVVPVVLGRGKRLFRDGVPKTRLELVDSKPTKSGALIVTYRPESKRDRA